MTHRPEDLHNSRHLVHLSYFGDHNTAFWIYFDVLTSSYISDIAIHYNGIFQLQQLSVSADSIPLAVSLGWNYVHKESRWSYMA